MPAPGIELLPLSPQFWPKKQSNGLNLLGWNSKGLRAEEARVAREVAVAPQAFPFQVPVGAVHIPGMELLMDQATALRAEAEQLALAWAATQTTPHEPPPVPDR